MAQKPYFTYKTHASDRDLITSTTQYSGQLKRYFSSLDAEVYIGGERILDIVRLDFSYEEKKMPYYGFNSFIPSRVFTGQKIIQGTFVINFTEPGYIAKLLQNIDASELQKEVELVGQACSTENAPLFAKSFDILVGYGGYQVEGEQSFKNTHQMIQGVHINGYQQILDTSGEPVLEVYSFIAKNLKFADYEYSNLNSSTTTDDTSNDTSSGSSNTNGGIDHVEKRLNSEVLDLKDRCEKDENMVGIVIDTYHSLHVKNNESHIYVDFTEIITTNKTAFITGKVQLTIHDNEVNLSKVYELINYSGDNYGIRLDVSDTKAIFDKLKKNTQKLVSCSLYYNVTVDGVATPMNKKVFMRKGSNY